MDDEAFVRHVGDRLAELPGVEAVTLGGSRAGGTSRPDSDWDFSLYYRGRFDPPGAARGWLARRGVRDRGQRRCRTPTTAAPLSATRSSTCSPAGLREQVIADSLAADSDARLAWPRHGITEDITAAASAIEVPAQVLSGEHDRVEPARPVRRQPRSRP